MSWPSLPSSTSKDAPSDLLTPSTYLTPQTLLPTAILTTLSLLGIRFYKRNLRPLPSSAHIPPSVFRKKSLYGYVTSVGDGDNFRFYHTPGGRLAGWGWLPGRRKHLLSSLPAREKSGARKAGEKEVRESTLHVRIAGVDAPELAHFGRPAQPGGQEALEGLKTLVLGRYVRVWLYRRDQYERVVGTAFVKSWFGLRNRDVGLEMLRLGLAGVYEAKFGSEFGGQEEVYKRAEAKAKKAGLGMWKGQGDGEGTGQGWLGWVFGREQKKDEGFETPREYKNRMKTLEEGKGGKS